MTRPTIRDVARNAQVSVATVSRVLNDTAPVREGTRQKVLAAIAELGYSPNTAARTLSGGRTYTIGVVTPLFTRPAFVARLAGIQEALDNSDYELVLYSVRSTEQLESQLHSLAGQNRVDGLIVISVHFQEDMIRATWPDFPLLIIDDERAADYPSIVIDNVAGGSLATQHMIARGHRKIGFIGDADDSTFGFVSSPRRFEGFQQTMARHGLAVEPAWCRFGAHSRNVARQHAREILRLPQRPTAIVAASDSQAFGVLAAADDLGLRVPDDIAVIGFDNIEPAEYMNLTTIDASVTNSGRVAAERLLTWIESRHFSGDWRTVLPMRVIERRSA